MENDFQIYQSAFHFNLPKIKLNDIVVSDMKTQF